MRQKRPRHRLADDQPDNHYPRAARGEVGLLEGWTLAQVVSEAVEADRHQTQKRAIVAIIDVPSQAYG
ncbi:biotin-independent malonate decarboxylase subunit gamma, partial [Serratia rubidaea]|uniref:biotin-independent malonate decarboxylase subunit gamma n=1 Tax=Serratia rubidaea TaxID=61652 RepID=UPI003D1604B1